jgi:iron complex transport system substrate-binding protein
MAIRLRAGATAVFPALGRRFFSRRHLVIVAGFLAACRGADAEADRTGDFVRDDGGRVVPVAPAPARVLSLVPSGTELLIELGALPLLVGRTAFDTHPALAHLPSLGSSLSPSLESIVALRPDLVITAPDVLTNGLATRLAELGLRVYEVDAQRLEDVFSTARRLAILIGDPARGVALGEALRSDLEALRLELAGRPPVPLIYLIWHAPPTVAGGRTYIDDLVRQAGGVNVFADVDGWAEVSLEEVLARDPAVVVVPSAQHHSLQPDWLARSTGWKDLPAVRKGRLVVVDSDLFNRPGPRVASAARALARGLAREGTP